MSNITDTIDMGAMTHQMRLVVPERFCSADISSEGSQRLSGSQHDVHARAFCLPCRLPELVNLK